MDGGCNPNYIRNMFRKQDFDTKDNQNLNYFIGNLDDSAIPVPDQNSTVTDQKGKITKEKPHPLCTSKVQQNTQHNRLRTLLHSSQLQRKQGLFTVDHIRSLLLPSIIVQCLLIVPPLHGTGQAEMPQISFAYWSMVRSLLNLPLPAVFKMDILIHFFLSL